MTNQAEFERIEHKIRQLVRRSQQLRQENSRLREQLQELRKELDGRDLRFRDLNEKFQVLQWSSDGAGKNSGEEKNELSKLLTAYMREIDHCITLLNA